jgi:hypothetical protein
MVELKSSAESMEEIENEYKVLVGKFERKELRKFR